MKPINEILAEKQDMEVKEEAAEISSFLQEKHKSAEMKVAEPEIPKGSSCEEEKVEGKPKDSKKKLKEASKLNPSKPTNHTIPRPFLLATEKRMSRERRASVDFSPTEEKRQLMKERRGSLDFSDLETRKLSKSVSLNKAQLSSSSAGSVNKRSAAPRASTNKLTDKSSGNGNESGSKSQMKKGVDGQQASVKISSQNTGTRAANSSKMEKRSTFKALPLPSFYHKKDSNSTRPNDKKEPKINEPSKSHSSSQQSAKASKLADNNEKRVSASRTISNRAKETINRMIRSTHKALHPSKETAKVIATTA